jgi:transcriptional regulator with PAS, ATPase and Fis domain
MKSVFDVIKLLLAENQSITNIQGAEQTSMETRQWVKAQPALGQSDWHRQNKDRAMCLISHARAAHQQLRLLQQRSKLTVIFETTGESQPGTGKGSVDKIIHQLGYSKVCA